MQGVRFSGVFYVNRKSEEADRKALMLAYDTSKVPNPSPSANTGHLHSSGDSIHSVASTEDRFMYTQLSTEKQMVFHVSPSEDGDRLLARAFNKAGISYHYSEKPKLTEDETTWEIARLIQENNALKKQVKQLQHRGLFKRLLHGFK